MTDDQKTLPSNDQRVAILYWSGGGNTERVAKAIERGCQAAGVAPTVCPVTEAGNLDLLAYDLVFLGCPSYSFLPPEPVLKYVKLKMSYYLERGDIQPSAPKNPGKRAVVFVTYAGPHTGIAEAIPVGLYLGQFFEHLGFDVLEPWYVVGEFHGREDLNTIGRLGDIRGRPTAAELTEIERWASALAKTTEG